MRRLSVSGRACALFVFCAAGAIATPAQTFTTLHSFTGADGFDPTADLIQAAGGKLYSTTGGGGADSVGTVFKITPSGMLTSVHSFDIADGSTPAAGLVQGGDGYFYGTTYFGGHGYGTVFKLTPNGALTTLHIFCTGSCIDGVKPVADLAQGSDGNFYGTTTGTMRGTTKAGGGHCALQAGCGTVFKISPSGTLTTLHTFYGIDGAVPKARLIQGSDGNFYGTTSSGGASHGTVFKITPSGALTLLHSFNGADGSNPIGGLVEGTDGNFYGTTTVGGAGDDGGTAFKITLSGELTTLYSFCTQTNCTDGAFPQAGLLQGTDGNFYGTTRYGGGANSRGYCAGEGCGTVFEITPSGTLTTLYDFCSKGGSECADGLEPLAGLVQDTNGTFYGTTIQGGANGGYGTVFSLSVGLGPFVKTNPASAKVGAAVAILGTNLTGATSVTFNGTAATFTVVTASEITTTVPTGATTGPVQVLGTSSGTLSSNVPFRVLP